MGNWIYNRATFPLVSCSASILSQLFVLVWWSSIDSRVGEQRIWSENLFFVFLFLCTFFLSVILFYRTFQQEHTMVTDNWRQEYF